MIVHLLSTPIRRRPRPRSASTAGLAALLVAVLTAVAATSPVVAAPCWAPPVDAPVADPFREPACRWCPGNRGIEYRTAPGTPVRAVAAGVVTFAGVVVDRRYVVVEVAGGRRLTYGDLAVGHLERGDRVVTGALIGRTGPRLHFAVRVGGRYVDPAPMIGELVGRRRLLPLDGRAPRPAPPPTRRCAAAG